MKLIVAIALLILLFANPSNAQQTFCGQRDIILQNLENKYQETPRANGVTTQGGLMELITNPTKDTWTLIISRPDGTSCFVAGGEGWRDLKQKLGDGI